MTHEFLISTAPEAAEVTEEKWDALEAEAKACAQKAQNIGSKVLSQNSRHVLNNLGVYLNTYVNLPDANKERDAVTYQRLRRNVEYLKKYIDLLQEFPEFLEGEGRSREGYAPDIFNEYSNNSEALIDAYEKRLRGEK